MAVRDITLADCFNGFAGPPPGWSGDLFYENAHGREIRYGYAPAQGDPRGTVVLTHGYGEHIELYFDSIRHYQNRGFNVYAMDWHGHGKSGRDDPDDPREPSSDGLAHHVDDLHDFVESKVDHDPAKGPMIMSTHSMGGHIGMLYLQKHPDTFDSAVMSAPMFDIFRLELSQGWRSPIRWAFNAANAVGMGSIHMPKIQKSLDVLNSSVRSIQDVVEKGWRRAFGDEIRKRHPDAQIESPTIRWIKNSFSTTDELLAPENLAKVKAPILVASAGLEDLVDNNTHKKVADAVNGKHIHIEDARHGLWFNNGDHYQQWLDAVDQHTEEAAMFYYHPEYVYKPLPREQSHDCECDRVMTA